MLYIQMKVWSVAIGNGCWSFSSINSDDLCVWFDWTGPKKFLRFLFQKVLKHSDAGNFGIITSKNVVFVME